MLPPLSTGAPRLWRCKVVKDAYPMKQSAMLGRVEKGLDVAFGAAFVVLVTVAVLAPWL